MSREIAIGIVGSPQSGKKTFLPLLKFFCTRLVKDQPEYGTYGEEVVVHKTATLSIEPSHFHLSVWANFLIDAHAFMYILDASNRDGISQEIRNIRALLGDGRAAMKPVLVVVNKLDKEEAMSTEDLTALLFSKNIANSFWRTIGCSSINPADAEAQDIIQQGLIWVMDSVRQNLEAITKKGIRDKMVQLTIDSIVVDEHSLLLHRFDDLRPQVQDIVAELEEYFHKNEPEDLAKDSSELEALQSKVAALNTNLETIETPKIASLINQIRDLLEERHALTLKLGSLEEDLADAKMALKQVPDIQQALADTTAQCEVLEAKLAAAIASAEQVAGNEKQVLGTSREEQELASKLAETESKVKGYEEQVLSHSRANEQLASKLADTESKVKRLEEQILSLSSEDKKWASKLAKTESKVKRYEEQIISLSREDEELASKLAEAESKDLEQYDRVCGELVDALQAGDALKEDNDQLKAQVEIREQDAAALRQELEAAKAKLTLQEDELQQQREAVERAKAAADEAAEESSRTVAHLSKLHGDVCALQEEQIAALKQQLSAVKDTASALKGQLDAKDEQLATVTQQLDTKEQNLAAVTQQLDTKEANLAAVTQQLDTKEANLRRLNAQLESIRQQRDSVKEQIIVQDDLREQMSKLTEDLASERAERENLEKRLSVLDPQAELCQIYEAQLTAIQEDRDDLKARLGQLDSDVAAARADAERSAAIREHAAVLEEKLKASAANADDIRRLLSSLASDVSKTVNSEMPRPETSPFVLIDMVRQAANQLVHQLQLKEQETQRLEQMRSAMQAERDSTTQLLQQQQSQHNDIVTQAFSLTAKMKDDYKALSDEKDALQLELNKMADTVRALVDDRGALRSDFASMADKLSEASSKETQLREELTQVKAQLSEELEQVKAQVPALMEELAGERTKLEEMAAKLAEAQETETEMMQKVVKSEAFAREQGKKLRSLMGELGAEIEKVQLEGQAQQAAKLEELITTQAALAQAKQDLEATRQQAQQNLDAARQQAQQDLDAMRQRADKALAECEELKKEAVRAKEATEAVVAAGAHDKTTIAQLQLSLVAVHDQLKTQSGQLEQNFRARAKELQGWMDAKLETIKSRFLFIERRTLRLVIAIADSVVSAKVQTDSAAFQIPHDTDGLQRALRWTEEECDVVRGDVAMARDDVASLSRTLDPAYNDTSIFADSQHFAAIHIRLSSLWRAAVKAEVLSVRSTWLKDLLELLNRKEQDMQSLNKQLLDRDRNVQSLQQMVTNLRDEVSRTHDMLDSVRSDLKSVSHENVKLRERVLEKAHEPPPALQRQQQDFDQPSPAAQQWQDRAEELEAALKQASADLVNERQRAADARGMVVELRGRLQTCEVLLEQTRAREKQAVDRLYHTMRHVPYPGAIHGNQQQGQEPLLLDMQNDKAELEQDAMSLRQYQSTPSLPRASSVERADSQRSAKWRDDTSRRGLVQRYPAPFTPSFANALRMDQLRGHDNLRLVRPTSGTGLSYRYPQKTDPTPNQNPSLLNFTPRSLHALAAASSADGMRVALPTLPNSIPTSGPHDLPMGAAPYAYPSPYATTTTSSTAPPETTMASRPNSSGPSQRRIFDSPALDAPPCFSDQLAGVAPKRRPQSSRPNMRGANSSPPHLVPVPAGAARPSWS